MSQNRFYFDGLEQLRAELRQLPAALAGEAGHLVQGEANAAAVAIRTIYGAHRVTGNLQEGVEVEASTAGQFGVVYVVRSKAPHAWLFDNGSQARHWAEGKSTGAMWGKTPPTHAFVRTMIAGRRRMYDLLGALLARVGLRVSGSFDAAA